MPSLVTCAFGIQCESVKIAGLATENLCTAPIAAEILPLLLVCLCLTTACSKYPTTDVHQQPHHKSLNIIGRIELSPHCCVFGGLDGSFLSTIQAYHYLSDEVLSMLRYVIVR